MYLKKLTDELIVEILQIYEKTVGGHTFLIKIEGKNYSFQLTAEEAKKELKWLNVVERRYGSKLSMHSKLLIFREYVSRETVIYFQLYPNVDGFEKESDELARNFEVEIDRFLLDKKLAISLK